MGVPTYLPIANVTLGSAATNVLFTNITQQYRDLVLITAGTKSTSPSYAIAFQFNGDGGNNYHNVYAYGDGTSTGSGVQSPAGIGLIGRVSTSQATGVTHFMDYSASDKHKTILSRGSAADSYAIMYAARWANNAPVTQLLLGIEGPGGSTFAAGMSFALYGVLA
jgi:hypothetical protein